jgi:hypothetical protein
MRGTAMPGTGTLGTELPGTGMLGEAPTRDGSSTRTRRGRPARGVAASAPTRGDGCPAAPVRSRPFPRRAADWATPADSRVTGRDPQ